jgi:5-methylcytosine-specific restriction protein A
VVANPDWTRDELIVALSFYLRHRLRVPGKASDEIAELSASLNRLGEKLFASSERTPTFRNKNGVYMKLMNFRRLDPQYTVAGKTGLPRGNKADEEVWAEFASDPKRCHEAAGAILAALDGDGSVLPEADIADEDFQEAPEGRLLTRMHVSRERNRKLVEAKRKQMLKRHRALVCEVCQFDFAARYGERGRGFIECHHTKPVVTLSPGQKSHVDDLALVCANCHRMIHRRRPWLSLSELRSMLDACL